MIPLRELSQKLMEEVVARLGIQRLHTTHKTEAARVGHPSLICRSGWLAARSAREVGDQDQRGNGECPQCEACPARDVLPATF
jgi:hypothetical protein